MKRRESSRDSRNSRNARNRHYPYSDLENPTQLMDRGRSDQTSANNRYLVTISPSSRAKCKETRCKQVIEKGQVRITKQGYNPFTSEMDMLSHYHVPCFFIAQTRFRDQTRKVRSWSDFDHVDPLYPEEEREISQFLE